MKYRVPLIAAAITTVLLATGLAWADGSGDGSSTVTVGAITASVPSTAVNENSVANNTSTTNTTATTVTPTTSTAIATGVAAVNGNVTIPDGTSRTFVIGSAGTVLLGRSGGSLQIIAATPNAGWSSEVEVGSGREVEGDFRNGELRVKYNFELEDGVVRVRIESQNGDDNDDNSGTGNGDDDDDSDDDNSGSGNGDDDDDSDDDNSGTGNGDDDDDNSGSG